MDEKKEKPIEMERDEQESQEPVLDGKGLHDFYRHTTKLIK